MKTEKFIIMILAVLVLLLLSGTGIAREIKDAHGKMGLSCTVCHGDSPSQPPETEACLTCHKSYEDVAVRTQALKPNPHDSHMGEVPCSHCHSTHGTSRLMCNDCHSLTNFKIK